MSASNTAERGRVITPAPSRDPTDATSVGRRLRPPPQQLSRLCGPRRVAGPRPGSSPATHPACGVPHTPALRPPCAQINIPCAASWDCESQTSHSRIPSLSAGKLPAGSLGPTHAQTPGRQWLARALVSLGGHALPLDARDPEAASFAFLLTSVTTRPGRAQRVKHPAVSRSRGLLAMQSHAASVKPRTALGSTFKVRASGPRKMLKLIVYRGPGESLVYLWVFEGAPSYLLSTRRLLNMVDAEETLVS